MKTKLIETGTYLLLIDEEVEIKFNDLMYDSKLKVVIRYNSYNDGCSKIIAYYPLTKEAKELDLPELPPFEVDIEELACRKYDIKLGINDYDERYYNSHNVAKAEAFIEGYRAAQSKQFSLEDMKKAIEMARSGSNGLVTLKDFLTPDYSEEEIIQSLSARQSPKEFIPEYINANSFGSETNGYDSGNFILKTITNSEGKKELVGTYKY